MGLRLRTMRRCGCGQEGGPLATVCSADVAFDAAGHAPLRIFPAGGTAAADAQAGGNAARFLWLADKVRALRTPSKHSTVRLLAFLRWPSCPPDPPG